jgi:hypothetical protein
MNDLAKSRFPHDTFFTFHRNGPCSRIDHIWTSEHIPTDECRFGQGRKLTSLTSSGGKMGHLNIMACIPDKAYSDPSHTFSVVFSTAIPAQPQKLKASDKQKNLMSTVLSSSPSDWPFPATESSKAIISSRPTDVDPSVPSPLIHISEASKTLHSSLLAHLPQGVSDVNAQPLDPQSPPPEPTTRDAISILKESGSPDALAAARLSMTCYHN